MLESVRLYSHPTDGDVPPVRRRHHVADVVDLVVREAMGRAVGARGRVVELTAEGGAPPGRQPRWRETDQPKHPRETDCTTSPIDGAKQACLVGAQRDAQAGEVGLHDAQYGEQDAKEGLAATEPRLRPGQAGAKLRG